MFILNGQVPFNIHLVCEFQSKTNTKNGSANRNTSITSTICMCNLQVAMQYTAMRKQWLKLYGAKNHKGIYNGSVEAMIRLMANRYWVYLKMMVSIQWCRIIRISRSQILQSNWMAWTIITANSLHIRTDFPINCKCECRINQTVRMLTISHYLPLAHAFMQISLNWRW